MLINRKSKKRANDNERPRVISVSAFMSERVNDISCARVSVLQRIERKDLDLLIRIAFRALSLFVSRAFCCTRLIDCVHLMMRASARINLQVRIRWTELVVVAIWVRRRDSASERVTMLVLLRACKLEQVLLLLLLLSSSSAAADARDRRWIW